MDDLEQSLGTLELAPYIVKAMALIGVRRRSGSNMYRHQISTLRSGANIEARRPHQQSLRARLRARYRFVKRYLDETDAYISTRQPDGSTA